MKRIVNIILLILLLTSCSSMLTPSEALDNCAIWQGCKYLHNAYIEQRLNDFQGYIFTDETHKKYEKRAYEHALERMCDYNTLEKFDEECESIIDDLGWINNLYGILYKADPAYLVREYLKNNPGYLRDNLISIIGTKREYLDYISQHVELLEWAYDKENSTKNFDSYLAIYELKEGDTFSYSTCRVTVRDDGSERYSELSHKRRYEDL